MRSEDIFLVHVVAGLHPSSGGPSRTVVELSDALAGQPGISVVLLSQAMTGEATVPSMVGEVERTVVETSSRVGLSLGLPLRQGLVALVAARRPRLIHNHGLWLPANVWASRVARNAGIPLLIHPRGMLEPWALQYCGWKKRAALWLYQRRHLEEATGFFATAEQEAESIRRLGLRQPIAIIPNGVDVVTPRAGGAQRAGGRRGVRTVLFLSRFHPKKGLVNLIAAWGRVRPAGWRLCLAGPDEGGHLAEVMAQVRQSGLGASVDYVGEIGGEAKTDLFSRADLFVLPSFSENFGLVIAEALAHGLPVIATHGTPWRGLVDQGCGWWIEPTVDSLAETLQEALATDSATLMAMGDRGRAYAHQFNWATIAQQTADVYRWVLGEGSRPRCVQES